MSALSPHGASSEDPYFSNQPWSERLKEWLRQQDDDNRRNPFLDGNVRVIRQIMEDRESGLRMVINISADALMSVLVEGHYRNLYEEPVIGGKRRNPSPERIKVDTYLGFGTNAKQYYFGAIALGGTGVRFYGEYCMVLKRTAIADDMQLFDRDSYDLLMSPLVDRADIDNIVGLLKGSWGTDVVDMLTLKLLPELRDANRLITTGTVSELALYDQEFVEAHYRGAIDLRSIEEIRQSPDEVALEARILARHQSGLPFSAVELRWLQQREQLLRRLEDMGIRYRIVTLHGRGYQWR